jgi:hypothetical protein
VVLVFGVAAAQQQVAAATASAPRHHRHFHNPKFPACEKQANAQKLEPEARRIFMRACLAK